MKLGMYLESLRTLLGVQLSVLLFISKVLWNSRNVDADR